VSLQCIELGVKSMLQLFAVKVREVTPLPEISDVRVSYWLDFSFRVLRILVPGAILRTVSPSLMSEGSHTPSQAHFLICPLAFFGRF
jgi:hypothetical protein